MSEEGTRVKLGLTKTPWWTSERVAWCDRVRLWFCVSSHTRSGTRGQPTHRKSLCLDDKSKRNGGMFVWVGLTLSATGPTCDHGYAC